MMLRHLEVWRDILTILKQTVSDRDTDWYPRMYASRMASSSYRPSLSLIVLVLNH